LKTVPWAFVLEKVVYLQKTQQLCVFKDLSAHDIVMRLMRKENYLIGMINKGVLAFPVSKWTPGAGPPIKSGPNRSHQCLILTKTLEWTLNWSILQSIFDRSCCLFLYLYNHIFVVPYSLHVSRHQWHISFVGLLSCFL